MDHDSPTLADSDGVSIHAGFPNPALERREQGARLALDFNQLLIKHPSSTYLFQVSGDQWAVQGIYDGDIAVVDRAAEQRPADLTVVWRSDGLALCRRRQMDSEDRIWGVVTAIVHRYH